MAQKKAHEVDSWLARPDPAARLVLVYGPDRGLVSERARAFAGATGLPLDDPFCVVRIDAASVEQQPGRLLEEAGTVAMFAASRLIWISGASALKGLADEVKQLLADPPADAAILIEAGELKKGTALRSAVEGARNAMALPCYTDDARGLDAVIDEELSRAGLTITLEARQVLKGVLGGDRLATRGELAKLVLYCLGADRIELEDVRAATGDASATTLIDAVDAALVGDLPRLDAAFLRHVASGGHPGLVLSSAIRQLQSLQQMRDAMEAAGRTAAAAVASARPPVFFARRGLVETALQRWSPNGLAGALERLQAALLQSRRQPGLGEAIARQTMLAIAVEAARAQRAA